MVRAALSGLFASLLTGCGPAVAGDGGSSSDGSGSDGPPSSGTATTANGTTVGSTTGSGTGTTSTGTTGDPDDDDSNEDADDGISWDHNCNERVFVDVVEVPLSLIEQWLDRNGSLIDEHCSEACQAAEVYGSILACAVEGAAPGSTSSETGAAETGASSSDGSSGSTGEGPSVLLRCEWMEGCGIGRGHATLQPTRASTIDDPIARWAARTAHAETASVGAFLALHDELASHGAPRDLLARARAAARDEIAHARAIGRIAARHGVAVPAPSFARAQARELEAIAIENAVEGCVRETWSALEAMTQARDAADPELRKTMAGIAEDETRHAELAHDLARWLDARLDDAARARVRAARDAAAQALIAGLAREPDARAQLGLPDAGTARTLAEGLRAALWS